MEFKKAVKLLNDGYSFDEIKKMSEEENIFEAPTPARAKNIYSTVSNRIKSLNSSFYPIFLESDIQTQKMIAFAADLAHDTLFFDFMYEVVREKMIVGNYEISDLDFRVFFNEKQEHDDKVAKFSEMTFKRLISGYKAQMKDAGFIDENRTAKTRQIIKPILDPVIRNWLIDFGYEPITKVLEGIR
jgi:hypothetical protein